MKSLLIAAFAALLIFASVQPVQACNKCKPQAICTQEHCRRCFTKNTSICGCEATYSQIVYATTYRDCKGRTYKKLWTKTTRIK